MVDNKNPKIPALIQEALKGKRGVKETAKLLDLSEKRVRQLMGELGGHGKGAAPSHGNSGRQPPNYFDENFRDKIIALKKSGAYSGATSASFQAMLAEREGIKISYSALLGILKSAGIAPKTKRGHFKRKGAFGEKLKAFAIPHDWLGDGGRGVLHGLIDDATGRITGLHFCLSECLMGYLQALKQTLAAHGVPMGLHAKKTGVLFARALGNAFASAEEKTQSATQLGSIAEKILGITITDGAIKPGARDCTKRLWEILQKRLARWLKRQSISDMETANRELHYYIYAFNNRFATQPRVAEEAFMPLGDYDPNLLLAARHAMVTDANSRFVFRDFVFQVDSPEPIAGKDIQLLICPDDEKKLLAHYNKAFHPVSFLGPEAKDRIVRLDDALQAIMQEEFYASMETA